MADNKDNYKLLWMMGLAITLPMILLSGPLAGYLIGEFALVKYLGFPKQTTLILMVLGLVGSGFQSFRIINQLKLNLNSK